MPTAEAYVGDVRAAVRRWHAESGNRELLYADHGDNLAIWDLRPEFPVRPYRP